MVHCQRVVISSHYQLSMCDGELGRLGKQPVRALIIMSKVDLENGARRPASTGWAADNPTSFSIDFVFQNYFRT